jgi:hypothetical protein
MRAKGRWLSRSLIAAALWCALPALAATIVGTVLRDGQPPKPGLPLKLSCGDKAVATGTTDARGGYRITVGGAGRCQLNVDGASTGTQVILNNQAPTQYDFNLHGSGASATLQRR